MSELKKNVNAKLAERIITLLDRTGPLTTFDILSILDSDPVTTKFILGFLLKFELIEYERDKDKIRLSDAMQFPM